MHPSTFHAEAVALNRTIGPEAGPPLVLLHGVTRRWQDFLPVIPALTSHWTVHALDFRGHGRSGRVAGAYRVIDYVPDALDYLRDFGAPAVVLGHSLGSMVAAAAAAEAPDLVRGLILEDPTFDMTGPRIAEGSFLDLFRAFQPHAGSGRPVEAIAAELADARVKMPGRDEPARLGDVRDPVSLRFSASCLRQLDPDVLPPAIAGKWLDGYDVEGTLGRIACPTLFLRGDFAAGGALPDDEADRLAGRIGGAVHVKLPGVGHNIHSSQPEALLRLVLPFLASLD